MARLIQVTEDERLPLQEWSADKVNDAVRAWAEANDVAGFKAPDFPVTGVALTNSIEPSVHHTLHVFFPDQAIPAAQLLAYLHSRAAPVPEPRLPLKEWSADKVKGEVLKWVEQNDVAGFKAPTDPIPGSFLVATADIALYFLKTLFPDQTIPAEQLLAHLQAMAAPDLSIAQTVSTVLSTVKWPAPSTIRLLPPVYSPGNLHAAKLDATEMVVAAPTHPDRPSLLLHRLGDIVSGDPLIQFGSLYDPVDCTVLMAESGAGKTRKLLELLHAKHGYYIPYKVAGDKNYGSTALSRVLAMLESDSTMHWQEEEEKTGKEISLLTYDARKTRATFAIYCVLIAFSEVFYYACGTFTPPQWLLVQLFPEHFLGADVFAQLACALYQSCKQDEVLKYNAFGTSWRCTIDEAQMLDRILVDKFAGSLEFRSRSTRKLPVLSPVLHGIKSALGRYPIIAGTGLTLLIEWEVRPRIGVRVKYVFEGFAPVDSTSAVMVLLERFLVADKRALRRAARALVGRSAKHVTEFIANVVRTYTWLSLIVNIP